MDIKELAKISTIPRRILSFLKRKGIIGDPLSREDQICLQFLEKIWGEKEMIRAQISRLSMKARLSLIRTAGLPTKWERYAYSRFRNIPPGQKLPIPMIVEEIQITFGFLMEKPQIKRLYTIRNRAHAARYRENKRQNNEQRSLT